MRIKLVVAAGLLVLAVSYLAFAGLKGGWVYHVQVEQFVKNPDLQKQRVRLCGKVSSEHLESNPGRLTARFVMQGTDDSAVPVVYHGTIPDLFKAGCDVVVEGRLDATGTFQADVLMTKCASKYQSQEHARRNKEM